NAISFGRPDDSRRVERHGLEGGEPGDDREKIRRRARRCYGRRRQSQRSDDAPLRGPRRGDGERRRRIEVDGIRIDLVKRGRRRGRSYREAYTYADRTDEGDLASESRH